MASAFCVFELRFEDRPAFESAFAVVSEDGAVESCLVESERLRIRLLATRSRGGALVERVYLDGGLVWCKRYTMQSSPD